MSKISIKDIVELAKAGYKPSDVKELFELAETAEAKDTKEQKPKETENQNGSETKEDDIDPFEKLAQS